MEKGRNGKNGGGVEGALRMNEVYVAISLNSNKDTNPKECARKDHQQARQVLAQTIKQASSD